MISAQTIARVRDRADVQKIVAESVRLVRRGRSFVGLCPFHGERSPSFHVTPERGVFHCFGCGEHGNSIDFVMKIEGLTFPEAVRSLAERFGVPVEEERGAGPAGGDQVLARRAAIYEANRLAAVYFEEQLASHPHAHTALGELARRGITASDLGRPEVAAFRLGYAPSSGGLLAFLAGHGVSVEVAVLAGLAVIPEEEGKEPLPRDKFRHRLTFAVHDLQGRIIAYSARRLPHPRTGEERPEVPKYMNTPDTPVYRKGETIFGLLHARHAIRDGGRALLVEGNFDVVSLHARGIREAVAPLGTSFTPEQAQMIKRFAPTAVFLFDGDKAGDKALLRARGPAAGASLVALAALLPAGEDPDSFVRLHGPEALSGIVRGARGITETVITSLLSRGLGSAHVEEKALRIQQVIDLVREEKDPSVQALARSIANDVAQQFMIRSDREGMADRGAFAAIVRRVETALQMSEKPVVLDQVPPDPCKEAPHAASALGVLLDFPHLVLDESFWEGFSHLSGPFAALLDVLRGEVIASGHPDSPASLSVDAVLAACPTELRAFAGRRLAVPEIEEETIAREHLQTLLSRHARQILSEQSRRLRHDIQAAQGSGDDDAALALLAQVQDRAKRRNALARPVRS